VNRYVAFYRDDVSKATLFASASFLILCGWAFVSVLFAFFVSFFLTDIFQAIPVSMAREAQVTCILVGVTLAIRILEANFSGVLQGFQLYTSTNVIAVLCNILRLAMTIIALFIMKSIIAVQASFAFCAALSAMMVYWCARRQTGIHISLRNVDRQTMRELWKFTLHSMTRYGSSAVMFNTMTLILGITGSATDVAIYNIACMIPNFMRSLLAGAQNVFLPSVSTLFAQNKIDTIKAILKRATEVSAVITLFGCLILFNFADEIMRAWLGSSVTTVTITTTKILILSVIPGGLCEIWLPVLVAMGFLYGLSVRSVATVILAIIVELVLLQGFVANPIAPALALTITLTISSGVWLSSYGLKKIRISARDYFMNSLRRPMMATFLSLLFLYIYQYLHVSEYIGWIAGFMLTTVILMVVFALISLRNDCIRVFNFIRQSILKERA
jgi:O-antigen/teichoic acid export membrane protein